MNKKKTGIIVVAVIIAAGLILTASALIVTEGGKKEELIIPEKAKNITVPNKENCQKTKIGYECEISDSRNLTQEEKKLMDGIKNNCSIQEGEWKMEGVPTTGTRTHCIFPYSDAQKKCSSSSECKGVCTVSREYVKQNYPEITKVQAQKDTSVVCEGNCGGTCSKYPGHEVYFTPTSTSAYRVENGKITYISQPVR